MKVLARARRARGPELPGGMGRTVELVDRTCGSGWRPADYGVVMLWPVNGAPQPVVR
jgi:hypothetical protein